jgi:branched-chain amino acid transport system permease protein
MDFAIHVATFAILYVSAAYALDVLLGETGILAMCIGAFCGVGAYTAAVLGARLGYSVGLEVAVACTIAAVASLVVSVPSFRLHDDYFVLATFALQVLFTRVANNWISVTGGAEGVSVPTGNLFGHAIHTPARSMALCLATAALCFVFVRRLAESPFGRVLRAIRSDELLVRALGKNSSRFKVDAFMVSAAVSASVGVLYAHFIRFVDPTLFDVGTSMLLVSMVIVGGAGSRYGPAVGAFALFALPEAFRFLPLPSAVGPFVKEAFVSVILLWTLLYRPTGIVGRHKFGFRAFK